MEHNFNSFAIKLAARTPMVTASNANQGFVISFFDFPLPLTLDANLDLESIRLTLTELQLEDKLP